MSTRIIVRIEDDWDIAVPKSELRKKIRFRAMVLQERKSMRERENSGGGKRKTKGEKMVKYIR